MKNKIFKFLILIATIIIMVLFIKTPLFNKLIFKIELLFTKPSEFSEVVFDKDSFQYVNDLYYTNSIYYNSLSNTEKEIYQKFLSSAKNYNESFEIASNTFNTKDDTINSIEKISYAITADHPELIQFSHSSITIPQNPEENYVILLEYTYPKEMYNTQVEYIKNCLYEITEQINRKK